MLAGENKNSYMHFLCLGRATCRRSGEKTEDEEVPLTEHEASL